MYTYCGIAIDQLGDLPDKTRLALLARLIDDCHAARMRDAAIHRARNGGTARGDAEHILAGLPRDPLAAHHRAVLDEAVSTWHPREDHPT